MSFIFIIIDDIFKWISVQSRLFRDLWLYSVVNNLWDLFFLRYLYRLNINLAQNWALAK